MQWKVTGNGKQLMRDIPTMHGNDRLRQKQHSLQHGQKYSKNGSFNKVHSDIFLAVALRTAIVSVFSWIYCKSMAGSHLDIICIEGTDVRF